MIPVMMIAAIRGHPPNDKQHKAALEKKGTARQRQATAVKLT